MEDANLTEPEVVDEPATTTAVIHGVVPMGELASFFDRSFTELATVLDEQGIAPTGPAFARYAGPPGETADLEVGCPVDSSVSPKGGVHASSLPAGPVARLVHAGRYDRLGETWGRLGAWMAEQGLTPGDDLWEVYVTEPTPDRTLPSCARSCSPSSSRLLTEPTARSCGEVPPRARQRSCAADRLVRQLSGLRR